jgi:hypothetical protein
MEKNMRIIKDFDSGTLPPYDFTQEGICFDLRPRQVILNVLLQDLPEEINVDILVDEQGEGHLRRQGLVVSQNGATFRSVPLTKIREGVLRATIIIEDVQGDLRISSRFPYGRDRLDKLICETSANANITWHFLQGGHRGLPMAQFGQDNGKCPIHYFIAGEDVWETAGCWVADEIVRELCRNNELAGICLEKGVIRIIPLVSPYSATTGTPSHCTLAGDKIYGAATWGDPNPPPEFALLRERVESTVREFRLGFLMTIHSWQSETVHTGLETIKSAGSNKLSKAREMWAATILEQMIDGVPKGKISFPEKIWHPGLARDYLLAEHNVISFRVEITTAGLDIDGFQETGRRFLSNFACISDWKSVCGNT